METIRYLSFYAFHPSEGAGFEFALNRLTNDFGIRVKAYPEADTYVLNYDQIESPKYAPVVRECRSLVINSKCEVVSRSFDRFFNYGEGDCEVDFDNAWAMEKVDGSLIGLYYNSGIDKWCFRTRGTAFAESELPSGRTYLEAILESQNMTYEALQEIMTEYSKDFTFIFEFASPENRIVTRYEKPELVLLATRDKNGLYFKHNNGTQLQNLVDVFIEDGFSNVRACKMYKVSSVAEVEIAVQELQNLEEGFVVTDKNNNRVKIKSPAYVKAHHVRGEGLTPKRIASLIVCNEDEEYLSVFPEDEDKFVPYLVAYSKLIREMDSVYNSISHIESQKEFALKAIEYSFSAILFSARRKVMSVEHAFNQTSESYRVDLLLAHMEK